MDFDPAILIEIVLSLLPTALTVLVSGLVLAVTSRSILARRREGDGRLGGQLALVGLTVVAVVAIILSLPIAAQRQGQLLSLLGLLLSGALALSSTNILGNIMSGLMLRGVEGFRLGDFVQAGDEFGRVSERGLFHIELQTPEGELTAIPNTWLASQPIRVLRSTGTLVSARVSLGYDVPRRRVETLLSAAAEGIGLEEPFVHVVELGDFSVSYRVAGMLRDLKKLLPVRSRLRGAMLDSLHEAGIEIVSPVVETHRAVAAAVPLIPDDAEAADAPGATDEAPAELFDKANAAALRERLEDLRRRLGAQLEELEAELESAPEEEREARQAALERARLQLTRVEVALEDRGE